MSVLVEAISVIVRADTIDSKYPGGQERYLLDCPNNTCCSDGLITRVGFMSPTDVGVFIQGLTDKGFIFFDGHRFVEIAVVDQSVGPTARCDWLTYGEHYFYFDIPNDIQTFSPTEHCSWLADREHVDVVDIAQVGQTIDPTTDCDGLPDGQNYAKYIFCTLKGEESFPIAVPDGWSVGNSSKLNLIRSEEST